MGGGGGVRVGGGSNQQPPDHQLYAHPTETSRQAPLKVNPNIHEITSLKVQAEKAFICHLGLR